MTDRRPGEGDAAPVPLADLAPKDTRPAPRPIGDAVADALARLTRRAEGVERPIPLPWSDLADALGGGLWPGCHVLIGPPKAGKSQAALQVAIHAARAGVPVLYVALELSELDVAARVLGMVARVPWSDLVRGDRRAVDAARGTEGNLQRTDAPLPLYVETARSYGWTHEDLEARAGWVRERHPLAVGDDGHPIKGSAPFLVVLDYLQVIQGDPRQTLRERIGAASYAARDVARDHDAAVLLVSSTAREYYEDLAGLDPAGKRPGSFMGAGKESGEVEYSADSVLVLGRGTADGEALLGVAAVRTGPGRKEWIKLRWDGQTFTDTPDNGEPVGYA